MNQLQRFKPKRFWHEAQNGFTIVELMIATLVFSVILLVITFGVIRFSADYYRGVNSSTTQNTARGIIDSITQAIQFSGGIPTQPTANSICIGNQQLVYNLGTEITGPSDVGLNQTTNVSCSTSPSTANGTELLGKNMRVTQLKVAEPTNPDGSLVFNNHTVWNVELSITYGDNDLLCDSSLSPTADGGCNNNHTITDANIVAAASHGALRCKSVTGSQYCDVVSLSTTVTRRIATGS